MNNWHLNPGNTVVKPRISIFEHAVAVLCSHASYSILASTRHPNMADFVFLGHKTSTQTMLLSKYTLYHDCLRTCT